MQDIVIRPARRGEGAAVLEVTRRSIAELSNGMYCAEQIEGWMGQRTPAFYEQLIESERMVVALRAGRIVGFVDAEPGEVTRLFLLREVAGLGLGTALLQVGVRNASGPDVRVINVESTLNAEGFYQHHGFTALKRGFFSHGVGGKPIEIVHMQRILVEQEAAAPPAV